MACLASENIFKFGANDLRPDDDTLTPRRFVFLQEAFEDGAGKDGFVADSLKDAFGRRKSAERIAFPTGFYRAAVGSFSTTTVEFFGFTAVSASALKNALFLVVF